MSSIILFLLHSVLFLEAHGWFYRFKPIKFREIKADQIRHESRLVLIILVLVFSLSLYSTCSTRTRARDCADENAYERPFCVHGRSKCRQFPSSSSNGPHFSFCRSTAASGDTNWLEPAHEPVISCGKALRLFANWVGMYRCALGAWFAKRASLFIEASTVYTCVVTSRHNTS